MLNLPSALGRAFLVSAFVPALVFAVLNALWVFPGGLPTGGLLQLPVNAPLWNALGLSGTDLALLIVATALAMLLNVLNTSIIGLFEGAPGWVHGFALKWLLNRRVQEHAALYGDLLAYREELDRTQDEVDRRGLRREINRIYRDLYNGRDGRGFLLPTDRRRLAPTTFGNLWATLEEYPFLRYAMDGTTFWPRLAAVIPANYAALISNHKMTMDTLLNLALLTGIFGVELLAAAVFQLNGWAVAGALLCMLAAYLFYRAAVSTLLEMGELVKSCYDLFRGTLLNKLGLHFSGSDIDSEREIWSRLNDFILAGDPQFYRDAVQKHVE